MERYGLFSNECAWCGREVNRKFHQDCPDCGKDLQTRPCPSCGSSISSTGTLCPVCNWSAFSQPGFKAQYILMIVGMVALIIYAILMVMGYPVPNLRPFHP